MIVQKNFLSKLRDFGLNTYESKLWTALLSRGLSTAGELSDIANVPRSRTYDVLESLERKGFIIRKLGKPIKYIAVSPEEVIERVKAKVKNNTDMQISAIEDLRGSEIIKELSLLHSQGVELVESTDMTASINGRENLNHHLSSRIAKAKQTVSLLTTSEGFMRKAEFLIPMLKKMKNVDVRIATQITDDMRETVEKIRKYADVRQTDIRGRFLIVDGAEVTFMLLDDKIVHPSYDLGVWVNTKFFASAFEDIFSEKWEKMQNV